MCKDNGSALEGMNFFINEALVFHQPREREKERLTSGVEGKERKGKGDEIECAVEKREWVH